MLSQHPTPVVAPYLQEHFARARAGEFTVQRCNADGTVWFPPALVCPECLGSDIGWVPVSGRATLWSWVVVHQPYLPAFADEIPYFVAYVQLEEGPLLMSTVRGAATADLRIDQPLQLELEAVGSGDDEQFMPVFRLAAA